MEWKSCPDDGLDGLDALWPVENQNRMNVDISNKKVNNNRSGRVATVGRVMNVAIVEILRPNQIPPRALGIGTEGICPKSPG